MNRAVSTGLCLRDPFLAKHPRPQNLRDQHRPIRLLIVLQNRQQRTRDGARGAVQGVDEARSLEAGALVSDAEPPRLVIGAVRRAGPLAIFAACATPWHPRFEIVFAISRTA